MNTSFFMVALLGRAMQIARFTARFRGGKFGGRGGNQGGFDILSGQRQ